MDRHDGKLDYAVPFPFPALLQRMEKGLQQQGGASGLKAVLIPLGRSLQRSAAAPEFFRYPRVVVTTDAEPAASFTPLANGREKRFAASMAATNRPLPTSHEGPTGMFLKDRIYLGYQEKANIIEVISYNEAAARFEFQLVKDYGPGRTPKVFYANRAVCMACHQNAAPIFSRQVWDETNANPKIAALLRARQRDFYGIRVDRGVDVPYAIDNATDRANLFAVHQLLWHDGCAGDDIDAIECRAGLFTALLQYRLSGRQQFDRNSDVYRSRVAARVAANGAKRWPRGLAIGNPDLPNRDPLPGERVPDVLLHADDSGAHPAARAQLASLSNVAAAFEPLSPRPALEVWSLTRPEPAVRAVTGLAEFVAEADIARLDADLFARGVRAHAVRLTHRAACSVRSTELDVRRSRVDFDCRSEREPILAMEGRLEIEGQRVLSGFLDRLQLGRQGALTDIEVAAGALKPSAHGGRVVLDPRRGGLHVRGAEGNAVARIELAWSSNTGAASAIVVQDFAPVREAVAAMVRANLAGRYDGFDARPFRRAVLLPALFSRLGMKSGNWCCLDTSGMPLPALESLPPGTPSDAAAQADGVRGFYRYCAQCHLTAEHAPPNFLAGDGEQVKRQLAQCAPRIYVRLAMGRRNAEARAKTPMPPEYALHGLNLSAASWLGGGELAALTTYVTGLLQAEMGKPPQADALLASGYENLRVCLPGEPQAQGAPRQSR
jgi:hypothetical protein